MSIVTDSDALASDLLNEHNADGTHKAATLTSIGGASSEELTAMLASGWQDMPATPAYTSASTFTIAGDRTAIFKKGVRIKFTQTSVKYFVVSANSTYSAPNTTVTVAVSTDYTIANAAITLPYYSFETPPDYPMTFAYTPTWTGGTGQPSTNIGRFSVVGNKVRVNLSSSFVTSNATTLTVTIPITAKTVTDMIWDGWGGNGADNGSLITTPIYGQIASAGTVINLYKDAGKTAWTNANDKGCATFSIEYEI